jgi:hypothetical protein
MFRIVEKPVNLEFPRGHHLHALVCQIANHLQKKDYICLISNPEEQWQQIRSIFDLVAGGDSNLSRLHFLVLPEAAMPYARVDDLLALIDRQRQNNSVTIFGLEHIDLATYLDLLERYADDNAEALASVREDYTAADIAGVPVNCCITAVKEADGRLRVFIQAKSHPFVGEETIDLFHDLYRGKVFPMLRCTPNGFNFMTMICLDYIYRDLYQSNISVLIDKANELFYQTRQRLDLLCVLECNPKPEHKAFHDVVNGFYGEYLAYTPGVRDTITVFCNSSKETTGFGKDPHFNFGHSMVIMHQSHKIAPTKTTEYHSDDFDGLPVCRMRFGTASRLYYFNLPLFHELDPRTTRFPLKIHAIYQPTTDGWERFGDLDHSQADKHHDYAAASKLDAANSDERKTD